MKNNFEKYDELHIIHIHLNKQMNAQMDNELIDVINLIQTIKQDLYKKHRPELVDGKKVVMEQRNSVTCSTEVPMKSYVKLIQKQQQILHRGDYEAQERAFTRQKNLYDTPSSTTPVSSQNNDTHKSWTKIPNNTKIQLVINYIDMLSPKLTGEQRNQLRYLLISSISQKKISKQGDIEYDSINGRINKIYRLSYDGQEFVFLDDTSKESTFPFIIDTQTPLPEQKPQSAPELPTVQQPIKPEQIKKKLILKKT
jgi:hypothetical protein